MLSRNPFRRPFPGRLFGRSVVFGHARTAVFVFIALLFVFSPALALAYGGVTFLVAVIYTYLTERLGVIRSGPRWTLLRWTLDQAVLLFLVSCACFLLYNATVGWAVLNLRVLLYITVPTVLVGLIPIVFSGVAQQLRAEQDHQRTASRLQLSLLGGAPIATGGAMPAPQTILYGKRVTTSFTAIYRSSGDYVLQEPIDTVAARLATEGIVRCHLDYLINLTYTTSVTADAQGLWLRLRDTEQRIPVSPAYFGKLP